MAMIEQQTAAAKITELKKSGNGMKLADFLKARELRQASASFFHEKCYRCMRSAHLCYCRWITAFESDPQFLILIHPIEYARRVASGRMAHLCMKNSFFFKGADFSNHSELNAILTDRSNQCVLLYPGTDATNLSTLPREHRRNFIEAGKKLIVIVVDGTWNTAGKMIRSNPALTQLNRICFTPARASQWKIRTQPKKNFVSTLEAIHECIELLGNTRSALGARECFSSHTPNLGTPLPDGPPETSSSIDLKLPRPHDILLTVFERTIDLHLELGRRAQKNPEELEI